ncbi:hypothetical protein GGS21DRAFT_487178 [Xylaria nigripes]|nr:hypothetical protein GGS21DRAFT_487178 [Xylaria nigripes]
MIWVFSFLPLPREWIMHCLLPPGAVAVVYLTLVRALRYRRRDGLMREYKRKHGAYNRDVLSKMTVEKWLAHSESIDRGGVSEYVLTCGIPTISQLLLETGEFVNDGTASRRAANTGFLVSEFMMNPPGSVRKLEGIARMNYLHKRFRRAGKFSDEDMLYTLSLFALESVGWVNGYDWRKSTGLELPAIGRDGLGWLEALNNWSMLYADNFVVPADSNEKVAWGTSNLLMFDTPTRLRGFTLKLISALLEDRLRVAMSRRAVSTPPSWHRQKAFSDDPDPMTGKFYCTDYLVHLWYVKPTFWARWSSEALRTRIWGGYVPGDEGTRFHPDGYHTANIESRKP